MDEKFTKQIQDWVGGDHSSDEAVREGALMLLKLNRNQAYYQRACKMPQVYRTNVEYELSKHLRIRLANKTMQDVKEMITTEMPKAKAILSEGAPTSTTEETQNLPTYDENGAPIIRRGKRADHDKLPENIAALWDTNAERYKRIKQVFETLKANEDKDPCDRYDDCQMLADLDTQYRKDMERYDSYVIPTAKTAAKSKKSKTAGDGENL